MQHKGEFIELFGMRLLLHERVTADATKINEFIENNSFKEKEEAQLSSLLNIEILLDALKFNLDNCFRRGILIKPFRYLKLKKILTVPYLWNNLGYGTLKKLTDKVRYELEGWDRPVGERTGSKSDGDLTSNSMVGIVSQFTGLSWDDAKNLPVSEFTSRLEEGLRIASLLAGAGWQKTGREKKKELETLYNMIDWEACKN